MKKAKILIVEDDDVTRRVMERMLASMDCEVILAHDGEEALKKVKDTPPDVILLDIMMPRMDGFEVARRLKESEETKIIPVVMVTSLDEVEHRVKALEVGADDFLTKPVDKSELSARVQSLLKVKGYNDQMRNYQKELETEVAERTKQIKAASLETVYCLSRAAEYKDEDTGAHIQRMSHYSAAVARKMGIEEETVEAILYASPMHDIGKIGIPDSILLKPGKLLPSEWEIMKQHTTFGARILEGSETEFTKLAEIVALTHHEKWNGSGYPQGLKTTEIPLAGRITAIADVFDAMTSRRPYRKEPLSLEETFRLVKDGRGNHFDPEVVDAFFAAKEEILTIKEKYKDEGESLLIRMGEIIGLA